MNPARPTTAAATTAGDGGWTAIGNGRGNGWADIITPAGRASYYVVAVDGGTGRRVGALRGDHRRPAHSGHRDRTGRRPHRG